MLRLGKKADYGLIALRHLAAQRPRASSSAKEIARTYGMPAELVAKVLQKLAKIGLLASQHGTNGGYALAKDPAQINAFEVIRALEGPLFITSCVTDRSECHQMTKCTVREPLRKVNEAIAAALRQVTVASLVVEPHSLIQIQADGKRT
ncbi:MAG: Rrf2 family transcriptional regulator [Terriglobia bacterium]|jgi:Rrf2 family protein